MTVVVADRSAPSEIPPTAEQLFRLDDLYDGLVSGRLCGQAFDPETAQLLMVLLERLEWTADSRQLAGALPHFPETFGVNAFRSTLLALGFYSTNCLVPGRNLSAQGPGALIVDERDRLWLLRRNRRRGELFRPGEDGESLCRVRPDQLYQVARFERPSGTDAVNSTRSMPQDWVGETIRRFVPEIKLMLCLTVLSGFTTILIAFGITAIFDTVIPTRNRATLAGILVGLALVFAFDFALRRIRGDIVGRVSGRLEYVLGSALLGKLLRLPPAMTTGAPLSDQLSRLRQFESIRDLFAGPAMLLMLELPLALLLLMTVAMISWPLALLLAGYASVFICAAFLLAPAIRRETRVQGGAQSLLNRMLLDVLEHRRHIGREGLGHVWTTQVDARVRDLARARRRLSSLIQGLDTLSQASLPIAAASVIGFGAVLVVRESLTGGSLVAVTILTWRLFAPVQQGIQILPKLQDVSRLFQQIDAFMRIEEDDDSGEGCLHSKVPGNLSVRGVVLRHPKSVAPALIGVNLDILHGAFVTVTGKSGSGKTTLLRVLAGHLAPQAGAVMFNDLNLTQLSRGFRARNISYVSQKPVFFYGSVAQNLRLADPDADTVRLTEVLGELGLEDWIASLPDGLETRLDPSVDHALLSPGVLTCLSVAQALLTDPVVLMLDEPAGHLDAFLEARLVEAIEKRRGRMTSVVVTHRPSLVRRSDSVIILNAGTARMIDTATLERASA